MEISVSESTDGARGKGRSIGGHLVGLDPTRLFRIMPHCNNQVLIRPARLDERDALEKLQWRASLANENDRPHLLANPDAIHLPAEQIERGDVLAATIASTVVGFAAIVEGELDGLFVEPSFWRQGVGKALIEAATDTARKQGHTLTVIANPHAIGFYERCGFFAEHVVDTRFGKGVRMSQSDRLDHS